MRRLDNEFRNNIASNYEDIDAQLAYADFLKDSEAGFSSYVRLWAEIQTVDRGTTAFVQLHTKRAEALAVNPDFWAWDNFLSLRHLPLCRKQIAELAQDVSGRKPHLAEEADVGELEDLIGEPLPDGYRQYVTTVCDSLVPAYSEESIFGVRKMVERIKSSSGTCDRLRLPFDCDWKRLAVAPRVVEGEYETHSIGDGFYLRNSPGLLELREFPWTTGGTYLSLHGETRGVIFACWEGHLEYLETVGRTEPATERVRSIVASAFQLPGPDSPGIVRRLPLNTVTAMHMEMLGEVLCPEG
jgi:uncharacterized protein (TIGR02996 family)